MNIRWDRFLGCFVGLAVGDALGTTVEFKSPGTFNPVQDMTGGGVFRLKPGDWTDDTSMALCLAESLVEKGGFHQVDQLQRYQRWYRKGHLSSTGECFDIGGATEEAVLRFERTGEGFCGSTDPNKAGNGSIMRLAPVVLFYAHDPVQAIAYAADSSKTTHAAVECLDACRLMAAFILGALQGLTKEQLLSPTTPWGELSLLPALTPRIEEIRKGSYFQKEPPEIVGSGYVVRSLEAALWAFVKGTSFEEGALLAVNLGNDADTTGAVYGQIAGAFYGYEQIPLHWRQKLAKRGLIEDLIQRLYLRCERG